MRDHVIRQTHVRRHRPIVINNWEATNFAFDETRIIDFARRAAALGMDMMVLDDGWFGHRDESDSSLGDWTVYRKKLPSGIAKLAENIRSFGMEFGLWFEPEMVSPDSDLYRAHPDWHLHIPGRPSTLGRNQLVLDMGRPEVVDCLFEQMNALIAEAKIKYIKWDANRQLTEVGSTVLPADRQGEAAHRFVLGTYSLLERLLAAHPDLFIEGCAGGGGRFDAGMLYYTPQIWTSDDTDAVERLYIQYGTSFGYPASAMSCHVSDVPNRQVGRVTPLKTRGDVAMQGAFGYELDPARLAEEDIAEVDDDMIYSTCDSAVNELEKMLSTYDAGQAVKQGIDTVIAGRPNVGKSTLMNLLSGSEKSIVTDIPGTTRDIVEDTVVVGDVILRLSDTAGLRNTDDAVEKIGVDRAKKRLEQCGLLLAVFDNSQTLNEDDYNLIEASQGVPTIAIINKTDLENKLDLDKIKSKISNIIYISAANGEGKEDIITAVEKIAGTARLNPSEGILSNERQRANVSNALKSVKEAKQALEFGLTYDAVTVSLEDAISELLEMTGEKTSDEVLDRVFHNFCVGK